MGTEKTFEIEMQTRDYECDLQGIINNAVYLNYLEHTRHRFLGALDLDVALLHSEGTDPVVRRIEIDYQRSLRGGDTFVSILSVEWEGRIQMLFSQKILRLPEREAITKANTFVTFVRNRRPIRRPAHVERAVERWWNT
jgi:acyl-CoA thioester hydrolase